MMGTACGWYSICSERASGYERVAAHGWVRVNSLAMHNHAGKEITSGLLFLGGDGGGSVMLATHVELEDDWVM